MGRDTRQLKKDNSAGSLGKLFKVQAGEGRIVLLLGGAALATEAGYWMGGNGLDGVVFGRFGSDILPYLLMLKGVMAFTAITLYSRWLAQINRRRMLFVITGITLLVLVASRTAIALNPPDWFYFL